MCQFGEDARTIGEDVLWGELVSLGLQRLFDEFPEDGQVCGYK